jgi:hypothetical protein
MKKDGKYRKKIEKDMKRVGKNVKSMKEKV